MFTAMQKKQSFQSCLYVLIKQTEDQPYLFMKHKWVDDIYVWSNNKCWENDSAVRWLSVDKVWKFTQTTGYKKSLFLFSALINPQCQNFYSSDKQDKQTKKILLELGPADKRSKIIVIRIGLRPKVKFPCELGFREEYVLNAKYRLRLPLSS